MRMLAISAAIAAAWTCSAHAQVYTAGGLPISILDTPTVTSTLSISGGPASLSSLSLVLRINHTYNGDLDIALIRNGKYLHLSSDNGGNANNIANLRFSDSALLSVTTITGPDVTGVYRPEGGTLSVSGSATIPLTGLTPVADFAALINGEGADGDWTLWIDDDASGDVGSLVYWSLEFNGELDPTGPEEAPPPPAFSGAFTGTPNELLPEQPTSGTTLWTGPNGAQPGLTRGAGEPGLGTAYLGLFGNFTGNEVAYRYQHIGGSVTLVLDTFLSTMEIAVIDESGTPAGCFAGSGDSISFGTKTLTLQDLAAGTYYVVVDSAGSSPGAAYTLTAGAPPANDTCETAEPVLAGGLYAFDTTFASLTVPSPTGCGFTVFSPDIWYVYTAPANGVATFSACDADFETVLSAHSVCGGQDFACRGSGSCGGDGASLEVCVTQGQTLLVRLAGAFDVRGTGTLSVAFTSEEASSYAEQPGVAEGETCPPDEENGDIFNGGCNVEATAFSTIEPGQTVVGNSSYSPDTGTRDEDWYLITLTETTEVTFVGQTQFGARILLVADIDECNGAQVIEAQAGTIPCRPGFEVSALLAAGTHAFAVVHSEDPNPCGSGANNYWFTWTDGSGGGCPACAADFNSDDGVDDLDIAAFFAAFEEGAECADVNSDDGIDDLDIAFFFAAFEAGC